MATTLVYVSGEGDEVKGGIGLEHGAEVTIRNGPRSLLVRLASPDPGTVDLTNYTLELAPYERYTFTAAAGQGTITCTRAPDGDMRHPHMATAAWRCVVEIVEGE